MSDEVGTVGWESKRANRAERECDRLKAAIERLIKERDEALEALRNLMLWVNPIAGDNREQVAAENELNTTMAANSILSKHEAKP